MHAVDGRNLIKMSFEFENVGLLQLQPTFAICPNYSNSSTFSAIFGVSWLWTDEMLHLHYLCPSLYDYYCYYSPVEGTELQ